MQYIDNTYVQIGSKRGDRVERASSEEHFRRSEEARTVHYLYRRVPGLVHLSQRHFAVEYVSQKKVFIPTVFPSQPTSFPLFCLKQPFLVTNLFQTMVVSDYRYSIWSLRRHQRMEPLQWNGVPRHHHRLDQRAVVYWQRVPPGGATGEEPLPRSTRLQWESGVFTEGDASAVL